jgi:hypothetical protein
MAWTVPRTWTDGELVTKAIMDPHIRDNFLAVGPHLIARKTSDQALTSNTTLTDVTTMGLTVGVSEIWQVLFSVIYTAGTAGDLKLAMTFPAGGTNGVSAMWMNSGGTAGVRTFETSGGATDLQGLGATITECVPIQGIYTNGGTGGTLQLQFAQNTSDGTATTIRANSTVWAVKLA